jgi:hypothetical protein
LVDEQDHQLGPGEQYFKTDDDLRLGTCGQDACTTGGTHAYGLDLFFRPVDSDVNAVRVRGLPNDGMPATLSLRHYCTGELIDTCTLDPGAQVYAECELDLPVGEPAASGSYYSLDVSIDSCFFVFDTIELVDQGS